MRITTGSVLGQFRKGRRGCAGLSLLQQLLCDRIGLSRRHGLALFVDPPQLEGRRCDHDQRRARDDVVAIVLPELFEALAADVVLDFPKDVGHAEIPFFRR
jgi:hypothetical protein